MATPRSGVSSKCAAMSLTFHFGETVCFSQSSGARERNRSRSRPSSLENKWAVRIGGNGLMAVFMDEPDTGRILTRSEEHTSELQSPCNLVCRLLLEKKKKQ